ncbi:MAG TPA: LysM peptidoglycan-binding domain-containing protein, partial [Cytophagaceae bacterium]|nr:LysM peptidoglycan-binding domain-containing protein [Cytophagaceae bacterium]
MVGDSILYPMETDTILLRQFVNLLILCEKLNFCYEDFVKLNPAIRTNVLPDNVNYPIRLPKEKKLEFLLNQHEIMECVNVVTTPIEVTTADRRRASSGAVVYRQKIVHTVRQGEVLGRIAGKYGISVAQVRSWNNLKGNTIRVGQKLLIYRMKYTRSKSSTAIKKESSYNRMQTKTSAAKTGKPRKYYYVQPGDTLWTISKKCGGISVERLKQLNNIKGSTIKVGQKLILG